MTIATATYRLLIVDSDSEYPEQYTKLTVKVHILQVLDVDVVLSSAISLGSNFNSVCRVYYLIYNYSH